MVIKITEMFLHFSLEQKFNIENAEEVTELTANFKYDDAAIIYINGHKVAAYDEPDGGFTSNMEYGGSNDSSPKTVDMKLSKDDLKMFCITEKTLFLLKFIREEAAVQMSILK